MPGRDGGGRGPRRAATAAGSAMAGRASIHAAAVGLVLVLVALTVFSVTAAVANARAAERAQASAVVSSWSEEALEQLLAQENVADELKASGPDADGEASEQYAEALAGVRHALAELRAAVDPRRRPLIDYWSGLHADYVRAVEVMLASGPTDPAVAEDYEESHVDPVFDPLQSALEGEVRRQFREANEALAAMGRSQQGLLVATPVVFGVGLALVAAFSVVLLRGRRLVIAQVEANRHQARHDALTGLPNRGLLHERLEAALVDSSATEGHVTLLLIDLDRFKEINDTLGHRYGDLVLQVLAERLRSSVHPPATVARLGGDEFAILLPDVTDVDSALRIAVRIQATMDASVEAHGVRLDVDASIGVVVSGEHGTDVETLLQHADIAMYRAKDRGLGVCVYHHDLNDHSREQLGLLGELRRAIDNGELVLQFQPKVTLSGEEFCGAEALVRWQHPQRGMLPPGLFVPVAERTALIHPLTRYVLDAALAECRRWQDEGRVLHVAVNVSVRNLLDDGFLCDVVQALARWEVPAACLELEVTESAIMADPDRAQTVLADFARLGVTLSIDDFGAGYTSLAHLSRLPVHTLKIDRSLVSRMTTQDTDSLIVGSVIELGHSLGLRTVAEGVEDAATGDLLAGMGCDVAQGYHFSRPIGPAELVAWHDAARARAAARADGCPDAPTTSRLTTARSS